eukprot:6196808-Pleurochrysis_carterae.AAC.1
MSEERQKPYPYILVSEANASSPSAGLAIESIVEPLLLKGLSETSLTEFNKLLLWEVSQWSENEETQ